MARPWSTPQDAMNRLLRRCVECPANVQPTCPKCPTGSACSLRSADCYNCASMVCLKINSIPGQTDATQSTPIGGIIGGVVGGVVVIIIATFLVWRFCIRRRKRQDLWEPPEKTSLDQSLGQSGTPLTRTHSIASTVMTRASNVIQIAYIPGVTVRSAPESPEVPPPIPSIPSTYAGTSTQTTPEVEQHFFMPKDLRDSVWSDTSSVMTDPRISIAPSLARASVATTIYQDNAVPAIPAQYAFRAQANAVSVRSGNSTPSVGNNGGSSPPVPQMPKAININGSSIVARNVTARPIEVKKSGSGNINAVPKKSASRRAAPVATVSDEKEVCIASPTSATFSDSPLLSSGGRSQQSSTISEGTPVVLPAETALGSADPITGRPTTAYTQAMIHEAMLRAVQDTSHTGTTSTAKRPELTKHDSGPFSDANEIK